MPATELLAIRRATVADIPVIAAHRARMFRDMGQLSGPGFAVMQRETSRYLDTAIPSGEYVGWLAYLAGDPARIIAGAGVQRRQALPHPGPGDGDGIGVAAGRHAIVLNVFTEPEWRRQGVAERLMREVIDWTRAERLDRLVLHASAQGKQLYERLGFVATNEMRLERPLSR